MNSSLDKLSSFLEKSDFKILQRHNRFGNLNDEQLTLLTRKGVYPYDYMNNWNVFEENVLPPKCKFYNNLKNSHISESDYLHANAVWKTFNVKTLGEYSDIYLETDVLLLADVFEKFRSNCIEIYSLDPVQYYTIPGFTWDCMLKFTKVKLELLSDIDMVLFFEKGIRGGLSQCSTRYSKANNKYMTKFNPLQPSKYLCYWDVNNLYGMGMSQPLPVSNFEWLSDTDINNFDFSSLSDSNEYGYVFEVDLTYPEHLHNLHKYLPFCPESVTPPNSKYVKLTTFFEKKRYVIHYRNLQQCLQHGLKLTKIHRVIKFKQSHWLKSYIDLNTELRKHAKNDFEKNLYKLMNNAVFGKTMENVRKHKIVKLVTHWDKRYGAKEYICKPNFHSRTIFNENLVCIEMNKTEIKLLKPLYVGMCILDISKTYLYDFHYNYILQRFQIDDCKLLYTDTDSLIYEFTCEDIYKIIKADIHMFDTSGYVENNIYNIPRVNSKVLGLMKDEVNGEIITEFVGLKSKLYSFKLDNKDVVKKAKGVTEATIKKTILFEDYINCLQNRVNTIKRIENHIKAIKHNVFSIHREKIVISSDDEKRYILENGIDTLPWGHYQLKN
ncbi:hypothetical protein RN001_008986 [Aquatica leii]|uniref:DNA-directed DNA polymerase n=1 Tax=Aquatica leii TaxID=1421715 RepID=A0AAN7P4Z0_9COLE|nr:hypothetical protein RN001_008986 [Aquatica leii]